MTSADLASPGSVSLWVSQSDEGDSNSLPFTISNTPFDSMSPSFADAGSGDVLLTVTGSCYESGAEILWLGAPMATTFVNATTLTATIPAADLLSPGAASVRVRNANGNTSGVQFFSIDEPEPTVSSVTPSSSYPPCAPFGITVSGQNFTASDEIVFDDTYLATTFVNSTTLTATLTSANLASPGVVSVYLDRPEVAISNSVPFTISQTPLDSLSPSSAAEGSNATVLTATGSCYESGATILWNGAPLATTFVNATTLTATIPAPNLASPGSASVTVSNANGNTSAALTFTIAAPTPVLTSISPTASYPPCAPFDITITG
ncbi:MAG TPA: IPT/TIG domain-containing protein, partial [candidate division Zixibacteria bacterium]|nr:IPT/TIG domain-containing protein [candidate division Zixibacteria bacterium]